MNLTKEEFESIQAYLNDNLVFEEKQNFEARLAADPVFSKEFELQKQLNLGLQGLAIKNKILKTKKDYDSKRKKTLGITLPKFYWTAAAIVVICSTLGGIFYKQEIYISKELKGLTQREIKILNSSKGKTNNTAAQYYLALTYIKQGQKRKAKNILEEIAATKNNYSDKAKMLLQAM